MTLPTGYSIWLDFDEASYHALECHIRHWCVSNGTPAFPPHLTLLGQVGSDFERIDAVASDIARVSHGFDLTLGERGVGKAPFQSRYLTVRDASALNEIRSQLSTSLKITSETFFPHISLQYCDLDSKLLQAWQAEAEPLTDCPLKATGLSVVLTEGEVDAWDVVASHSFIESQGSRGTSEDASGG